ncbi:hypothetical protein BN433_0239 [Erwinia amylovora Ea266]|nr:hypothetical protein BN433_0239 [Erwinia amylovora Ea266]
MDAYDIPAEPWSFSEEIKKAVLSRCWPILMVLTRRGPLSGRPNSSIRQHGTIAGHLSPGRPMIRSSWDSPMMVNRPAPPVNPYWPS